MAVPIVLAIGVWPDAYDMDKVPSYMCVRPCTAVDSRWSDELEELVGCWWVESSSARRMAVGRQDSSSYCEYSVATDANARES